MNLFVPLRGFCNFLVLPPVGGRERRRRFTMNEGKKEAPQGQAPKPRSHDGKGIIVGSKLGLLVGEKIEAHHLGYDTATMQLGKIYISNFRLLFVPDDPHKVARKRHRCGL